MTETVAQNRRRIRQESRRRAQNESEHFEPSFEPWRHGGWYVVNITYPSGAVGCVSRNYPDRKWRIACDPRASDHVYPDRVTAAKAERFIALAAALETS